MTELKDLPSWMLSKPEWLVAKMIRHYYSLSDRELKRLRDEKLVEYKWIGNKPFYKTKSLDAYFAEGATRTEAVEHSDHERIVQKGELESSKKFWSKPDSRGRCQLDFAEGGIREWPGIKGNSYYIRKKSERDWKVLKGIRTRADAIEEYRKSIGMINEDFETGDDKKNITLGQFFLKFSAYQNKRIKGEYSEKCSEWQRLSKEFSYLRLPEIDFPRVVDYVESRLSETPRPADATVIGEVAMLRRMFNVAKILSYYSGENPLEKRISELGLVAKSRDRAFNLEEELRLFDVIKNAENEGDEFAKDGLMVDFLIFAFNTGIRISNIVNLKWKNVDIIGKTFTVESQEFKNQTTYTAGLNQSALDVLARCKNRSGDFEYVFTYRQIKGNQYGKTGDLKKYDYQAIRERFAHYLREANIENIWIHDIRRSAGRYFYSETKDILATADFFGHKDVATTLGYLGRYNRSAWTKERACKSPFWGGIMSEEPISEVKSEVKSES